MRIVRLQDKVAIVTGASRGIGKAISELYVKEGAKLTLNYNKSEKEALVLAEELKKIRKDLSLTYSSGSLGLVGGTIALLYGLFTQDSVPLLSGGITLSGSLLSWIKSLIDFNRDMHMINSPIGLLFDVKSD